MPIGHPHRRPRRLRLKEGVRALVEECTLRREDLLAPVFVSENGTSRYPIPSLPGVERVPLPELASEALRLQRLGLRGVVLFPVNDPEVKTADGREAYNREGLVQRAIAEVKRACPGLIVFADVALDPFTTHGHDGIVDETDGEVLNDETVEALCRMSLTLADAGVDFVAPSDMMDGRIGAIRNALDEAGHWRVGILAYSAKFASAFYGPFREAVASGARGLDKKGYQLTTGNLRQARLEVELDEAEGADMVMVKPALPYLDVVRQTRETTHLPVVAYHVSGEYAMLKAAVEKGWLDEAPCVRETLVSLKRAGADLIVTYYAAWACENIL
ncbi:MAG: porphobilinogen synthase [Silvanigrellales bacterium]|nr:porphobilinogen synthase [Silvanigrellales bacterium]